MVVNFTASHTTCLFYKLYDGNFGIIHYEIEMEYLIKRYFIESKTMSKINNIIESIDNSFAAMLFSAIDRVDDTNAKRAMYSSILLGLMSVAYAESPLIELVSQYNSTINVILGFFVLAVLLRGLAMVMTVGLKE